MVAVKGSKQPRLKVVPYRPMRQALIFVISLALVVCAVVGSYFLGQWQGTDNQVQAIVERNQLRTERVEHLTELERLRQQVVNLELAAKVDAQAGESVRSEVRELKQHIAGLEADIALYRGLMAPNEDERGIRIGEITVNATNVPGRYRYRIVVQQVATDHPLLNGAARVQVVGRREGELLRVPLYQLSEELETDDIRLRFRYFQNIEGELMLPSDFTPEHLEVVAESTGTNAKRVEKRMDWQI